MILRRNCDWITLSRAIRTSNIQIYHFKLTFNNIFDILIGLIETIDDVMSHNIFVPLYGFRHLRIFDFLLISQYRVNISYSSLTLHLSLTRRNLIKSLYLEGAASFVILIEKIFWHNCLSKCLFFGSATFNISVCLFISQKGILYLIWVLWFLTFLFVCLSKRVFVFDFLDI